MTTALNALSPSYSTNAFFLMCNSKLAVGVNAWVDNCLFSVLSQLSPYSSICYTNLSWINGSIGGWMHGWMEYFDCGCCL